MAEEGVAGKALGAKVHHLAQELFPQMVAWRRAIHRRPGLGFAVEETAELGAQVLQNLGWEVRRGVGGTGVKAVWPQGARRGPAVLLRADMDGLPLMEDTGLPYASEIPGRMHACGHDMHVACVLGAASILTQVAQEMQTPVVVALQPAEEGPGGAEPMIRDGLLEDPPVGMAFMLHVDGSLVAGQVGIPQGYAAANCDDFTLVVRGRTAHGSRPDRGVDAICAAGQVLVALQSVVARQISPLSPAVVSVGTIRGGDRGNVVADRVEMTGTLRSLDDEVRRELVRRVEAVARAAAQTMGAEIDFQLEPGYPAFTCHPTARQALQAGVEQALGPGVAIPLAESTLGAEDFAYIARAVPAAVGVLGVADRQPGDRGSMHSRTFRPEERALTVGAATLAMAAVQAGGYLREAGEGH
jgi:amidohydrolase